MSNAKVALFIIIYAIFTAFWFILPSIIPPRNVSPFEDPRGFVYGGTLVAFFIVHVALLMAIYHDAKSKHINENWWVIAFILGWPGGIIYLILNRNKGAAK
jgi:hypothetical protein